MKTKYRIILFFLISQITYSQWYQLQSGTNQFLYSANFIDVNTGWISGQSKILKTTNAGNNWVNQSPANSIYIRAAYFVNQNTGLAVGSDDLILKTTDSGNNWTYQSGIVGTNWHSIFFIDEFTGWIAGSTGRIIKTTNGGISWLPLISGLSEYLYSVYFISGLTGWVAGDGGRILKTTNGGVNWILQTAGFTNSFMDIKFVNSSTGWLTGRHGDIFKTIDGGAVWYLQASLGSTLVFNSIDFTDGNMVWVAGEPGQIFASTNGGIDWNLQQGGGNDTLVCIEMINSSFGYITGFSGTILKTINGGFISVQPISEIVPKNFSFHQNYPNPFNPATNIKIDLPKPSFVKLIVYDILGREIAVLINEYLKAGSYSTEFNAGDLTAGIYICKIITDEYMQTKKMILVK